MQTFLFSIYRERNCVAKNLEKAENDLIALRTKYEELKRSREDTLEQVNEDFMRIYKNLISLLHWRVGV